MRVLWRGGLGSGSSGVCTLLRWSALRLTPWHSRVVFYCNVTYQRSAGKVARKMGVSFLPMVRVYLHGIPIIPPGFTKTFEKWCSRTCLAAPLSSIWWQHRPTGCTLRALQTIQLEDEADCLVSRGFISFKEF